MWKAACTFLFNILAGLGAFFAIRQGGKTSQKLKAAEETLESVRRRDEIRTEVPLAGADAARERMRNRRERFLRK